MRTSDKTLLAEAKNIADLREAIRHVDITIRDRGIGGRRSEHVERFAIAHLLNALPATELRFPIQVWHADRPDFWIEARNGLRIAIEHTEAVPPNEAKKDALRANSNDRRLHFAGMASPNDLLRSTQELRQEIEDETDPERASDGWVGHSAEATWVEAMLQAAESKLKSVQKAGYDRGDSSWLLIYDNWGLPVFDPRRAAKRLSEDPRFEPVRAVFAKVLILDGAGVWHFSKRGVRFHRLKRPE